MGEQQGSRPRVAAMCLAIENYTHLDDMENAARDAEALHVRLNSTPGCSSALTKHAKVTASSKMLLRAVRASLQEAALAETPPDLFLLYYAGHTVQLASKWGVQALADTRLYLVPAGANPKREGDCDAQCLAMDKLLNVLRKDLCAPVQARAGKAVVFLLLLDSVRRVLAPDGGGAADRTCGVTSPTAPSKATVFVAHFTGLQRKVVCEDGEHSPLVRALLDSQAGVFADGISIASVLSKLACSETAAASVGLDSIPPEYCIVPAQEKNEVDAELRTLLEEWKLGDQAELLAANGVLSLADLESMAEEEVDAFGLNVRFRALLQHVHRLAALRKKDKKHGKKPQQGSSNSKDSGEAGCDCELDLGNEDAADGQDDADPYALALDLAMLNADALLKQLEHFEETRDVSAIVSGMGHFIQDASVQEMGSRSIWFLASDDDLQALIAREDGIEAVLAAMRAHPKISAVQEAACAALSNLAHYNSSNQVRIAAEGGIERMVEAMKVHPEVGALQEHGCAALADLASNTAVGHGKIVAAGGVERVVAAMAAHPISPRIQEHGCAMLSSISALKEHQIHVVWAGGIERTVAAMHGHPAPEVQQAACFSLRSLSLNSTANQMAIAKAGGVERLHVALNSLVPLVQKAACAALLSLCSCMSVAEKIRLSGTSASLKNMISAPDVSKDAKRLGTQLLNRLESDASPMSSPLASPVKGARTPKSSSEGSPVHANGREALPGDRQLRRRLSMEDSEPFGTSPKSSSSPKGGRRLALDDRSSSNSVSGSRDAKACHAKQSSKVLKLPQVQQVDGRAGVVAQQGAKAGTRGSQVMSRTMSSLQNAGNKAKELFAGAGWHVPALPFMGSGGLSISSSM